MIVLKAMTVLGPVDVSELGFTLPHEHIMFDSSIWATGPIDPWKLRRLSQRSGLNIVVATGCYVVRFHPPHVANQNVNELTAWMIKELTAGIDGTDIRARLTDGGLPGGSRR